MTRAFTSPQLAGEAADPNSPWPSAPLETFLRQNAARANLAFTRYMLDAYAAWRQTVDHGRPFAEADHPSAVSNTAESSAEATGSGDMVHCPFDAFCNVPGATMRGFIRLLPHRISFATAMELTGMDVSEIEALTTSLRAWLAATQPARDIQAHIQLGFDPLASELKCPHCASGKAPVFFGLSWHHIQVYRCDACSQLFEAHQGLPVDANNLAHAGARSHPAASERRERP